MEEDDGEHCWVRTDRSGEPDRYCDCWWEGDGCCACGAAAMTEEEQRAAGMLDEEGLQ